MTIYIVDDENLKIREEFFDVANLEQFRRDMDDSYDGLWFEDIQDAKGYVNLVRAEHEESKCNHVMKCYPTVDEGYNECVCQKCGYNYLESTGVI